MRNEFEPKGETPIEWRSLTSLPNDARLVLAMRQYVRKYRETHKIESSVADLIAEQELLGSDSYFKSLHERVNQPIAFVIPSPMLRVLAWASEVNI